MSVSFLCLFYQISMERFTSTACLRNSFLVKNAKNIYNIHQGAVRDGGPVVLRTVRSTRCFKAI